MKIKLKIGVSDSSTMRIVEPADFGMTDEGWNRLDAAGKEILLNDWISGIPEQPYWTLDSYHEEE